MCGACVGTEPIVSGGVEGEKMMRNEESRMS
jgi:hypothetical protein